MGLRADRRRYNGQPEAPSQLDQGLLQGNRRLLEVNRRQLVGNAGGS